MTEHQLSPDATWSHGAISPEAQPGRPFPASESVRDLDWESNEVAIYREVFVCSKHSPLRTSSQIAPYGLAYYRRQVGSERASSTGTVANPDLSDYVDHPPPAAVSIYR